MKVLCVQCRQWKEDVAKVFLTGGLCKECEGAVWSEEELAEMREGIEILADDMSLDADWVEMMIGRCRDVRENPDKFLTIDEFIDRCKEKGLVTDEGLEEGRKWVRETYYGEERDEVDNSKGSTIED